MTTKREKPMRPTMALLRKDLLLERRAPESIPAMVLFSITTFVLFHFGLGETRSTARSLPACCW